jgi:hypothetical protein
MCITLCLGEGALLGASSLLNDLALTYFGHLCLFSVSENPAVYLSVSNRDCVRFWDLFCPCSVTVRTRVLRCILFASVRPYIRLRIFMCMVLQTFCRRTLRDWRMSGFRLTRVRKDCLGVYLLTFLCLKSRDLVGCSIKR